MKKILSVIIILSVFLTSCLKDTTINSAGALPSVPTVIQLPYKGLANFAQNAVLTAGVTDPIVEAIVINVAGRSALASDLTVTLAVDDAVRTDYNATSAVKYDKMPDSCFSFPVKTTVIPAGHYLDTVYITFYPDKIDPTKNYMAAVAIKDAQGQVISGNFGIAYYHTIGNPLAGNYNSEWIRYNNAAGTGSPNFDLDTSPTLFSPLDPLTVTFQSGTGPYYVMSFTNVNGVLSNFKVAFDAASVAASGITITSGPKIVLADPATGQFTFNFTYNNSSGAGRNITDRYYK
jgi:hypothetical protein